MEPLRIIVVGEMEVIDARVHVGGVALADLLDHLPSRYVSPAKAAYGPVQITVDTGPSPSQLALPEVAA
jgi:hypothetical protein